MKNHWLNKRLHKEIVPSVIKGYCAIPEYLNIIIGDNIIVNVKDMPIIKIDNASFPNRIELDAKNIPDKIEIPIPEFPQLDFDLVVNVPEPEINLPPLLMATPIIDCKGEAQ